MTKKQNKRLKMIFVAIAVISMVGAAVAQAVVTLGSL
jgi:cytochrome c-type biogenesis protein CcmE